MQIRKIFLTLGLEILFEIVKIKPSFCSKYINNDVICCKKNWLHILYE
jgi:hypothetical protein